MQNVMKANNCKDKCLHQILTEIVTYRTGIVYKNLLLYVTCVEISSIVQPYYN